MILSTVPVQVAEGQGTYSERLNVFVAGSNALWYFTFGGINGSSRLSALESTPGLSWYNVTAIKTTGWQSDFQVFGPMGYNLVPVPFVPTQGLFLKVGSDSFADASAAASALDSYLLTNFVSLSNGTGSYTFYSPLSFDKLVPPTLLTFLPSGERGFASAISSKGFLATGSPFVVLEGQKSASEFDHTLVVGSISASAMTSAGSVNILGYYGSTITSLQASNQSSSSVVQIRSLDGMLKSTDKAAVTTDSALFTGSYTLTMTPGKKLLRINATIAQQPAILLATRSVDVGVLRTGDNISVTLTLKNLSPSYPIGKISFVDNWWNKTGVFRFLAGNDSVPGSGLPAGSTITPVYRLQYIGTTPGALTVPASVIRYSYIVRGVSFNATAVLDPIRLSLNQDDAVVYATMAPVGGPYDAVGKSQNFSLTVVNVGTLPASSVFVAGHSISGLAAKSGSSAGGTATVSVFQSASSVTGVNTTKAYTVTYQNPSGTSLNSTANVIPYAFTHNSMQIGFPIVSVSSFVGTLPSGRTNVTLSFSTSNAGQANVNSFTATGSLPSGLGCGTASGKGLSCESGLITISYHVLNKSNIVTTTMKYNLSSSQNYIMGPLLIQGNTSGISFSGESNAAAIPAGLAISKAFSPAQLFGGMSSSVSISASNSGPLGFYNVTLGSTADSFDSLANNATSSKRFDSIGAGANLSLSYGVITSQVYGILKGANATASFFFGGSYFTLAGSSPVVEMYQPLTVSIATAPVSPIEGKSFAITFVITNPTGVQVSDVVFTLPLPSGLKLSDLSNAQVASGDLTITDGTLGPHENTTATAAAVASSGITIPFNKATLTFAYQGITVNGKVPTNSGIAIGEDVTIRYIIPTLLVLLVLILTAFYVRRKAGPSVPASQK